MSTKNIAFDQFQRYQTASTLIDFFKKNQHSKKFKILELGSNEHKNLGLFLPNDDILYTDINLTESMKTDSDFKKIDGTKLDLPDDSFDFVIALDVLEHIPKEKRKSFLENANTVAKMGAIISFPYNNNLVHDAESRINSFYKTIFGANFVWIKEHMENGLPDIEKTLSFIKDVPHFLFYHGSLDLWEKMWYTHFKAVASQETLDYRKTIDHFYNTNLYDSDNEGTCYRAFLVLAKENKDEWQQYTKSIFEVKKIKEDSLKKLDLLCSTQNMNIIQSDFNNVKKNMVTIQNDIDNVKGNMNIILNEKKEEIENIKQILSSTKTEKRYILDDFNKCMQECNELHTQRDTLENMLFEYEHAFFWRITKPLRNLSSILKRIIKSNRFTLKFAKGLRY